MVAHALSEALLLAGAGGALGLGLAWAGVGLVTRLGAQLGVPRLEDVGLDATVLLFALGVAIACAALVSVLPVARARRVPIAGALRASGRTATEGPAPQRLRGALVIAQVALALVLVATSGLFARSFARLRDVEPGFDADRVTIARMAFPRTTYPGAAPMRVYASLLERVRALPGVTDAAIGDWVPLSDDHNDTVFGVEDHPLPPNVVPRLHFVPFVDGAWFQAMRVPVVAGRVFGPQDPARGVREAVVSRAFVERYWPGKAASVAIGRRIRPGIDGPWWTIIGVVGDVHLTALDQPAEDAVYFPLVSFTDDDESGAVTSPHVAALFVRTSTPAGQVTPAIRQALKAIDPAIPTYDERPLDDVVGAASARARVTLLLLGLASAIALVLGAVGLYGVMAYGVSLRRREIGVRLALGARPADVRGMISRQGGTLGVIGVVIGTACALAATRLLRGLLYDVSPTDPLTLGATGLALPGIPLLASWIPARRAAAVDPAVTLRGE